MKKKKILSLEYSGRYFKSIEVNNELVVFSNSGEAIVSEEIANTLNKTPYIRILEDVDDSVQKDLF